MLKNFGGRYFKLDPATPLCPLLYSFRVTPSPPRSWRDSWMLLFSKIVPIDNEVFDRFILIICGKKLTPAIHLWFSHDEI